jgi:hypothetical protein
MYDKTQYHTMSGDNLTKIFGPMKNNSFPVASNDANIDPITLDELLSALTQLKNKKAPGSDEINIELLKEAPLTLLIRLLDLINVCLRTGHAPEEWNIAVVTPIHKKGSRNDCSNY